MQIENPATTAEQQQQQQDEDMDRSITLTIVPSPEEFEYEEDDGPPVSAMYTAVTACQNLHPDPPLPGEQEEGLPGSSGWITAENMHEYVDDEGNFIDGGRLASPSMGPGAGSKRKR